MPELSIRNAFGHMAQRSKPDITLTPNRAEECLLEYLNKLSAVLANKNYDPNGSLHAVVFGEWGHGKTQVLYRIENHITVNHSDALVITIIPEVLNALEILRIAKNNTVEKVPDIIPTLDAGINNLKERQDQSSSDAMRFAADTLVKAVGESKYFHTVLLFDEVQTMEREAFQAFLEELVSKFSEKRLMVHILQCHSLASLEDARILTKVLGDWLGSAFKIQLPSIEMANAYEFFMRRIADFGGNQSLQEFISEGISKTICEAVGGNPRKMLTLADQLCNQILKDKEERITGHTVLKVLEKSLGPKGEGTKLFMRDRLNRIFDLIPQEINKEDGEILRRLLEDQFSELYAERKRYTITELVNLLDVTQDRLQALQKPINNITLFISEEDELFDTTEYLLSDDLRFYLSESYGSTGSFNLKQLQYGLIINPTSYQRDIAFGLAKIFQNEQLTVTPPEPVPLGSFPNSKIPITGYKFKSRITHTPKVELFCNVLVTNIFGAEPPEDMINRMVEGLKNKEWLRVFIFFDHPELSWDQWMSTSIHSNLMHEFTQVTSPFKIIGLDNKLWGDFIRPMTSEEALLSPKSQAVRFWACIGEINSILFNASLTEELSNLSNQIGNLFKECQIQLKEACYLPSDEERTLLDSPLWIGERKISLAKIRKETGKHWTQRQLDLLDGQYIKSKMKLPWEQGYLYKSIVEELKKENGKISKDLLSRNIGQRVLIPDHEDRLSDCVNWMLKYIKEIGHADYDMYEAWHINIVKDCKQLDKKIRQDLKKTKKEIEAVKAFDDSYAAALIKKFASIETQKKDLPDQPRYRKTSLEDIEQELNLLKENLKVEVERIAKHKSNIDDELKQVLGEIKTQRDSIENSWKDLILPESLLTDISNDIDKFLYDLENKDEGRSSIDQKFFNFQSRLNDFLDWVKGNRDPKDNKEELFNLIASKKSFNKISISYEELF